MTYIELKDRCERQMALAVCDGCTACWLRCADGVQASQDEWTVIERQIADLKDPERERLETIVTQSKSVDLGDGVSVTMCRFFDMHTHRCAIYSARPLVCRLLGHVEWLPCPINQVPAVVPTPDALALMRSYAQHERRTFAEWENAMNMPPVASQEA